MVLGALGVSFAKLPDLYLVSLFERALASCAVANYQSL